MAVLAEGEEVGEVEEVGTAEALGAAAGEAVAIAIEIRSVGQQRKRRRPIQLLCRNLARRSLPYVISSLGPPSPRCLPLALLLPPRPHALL